MAGPTIGLCLGGLLWTAEFLYIRQNQHILYHRFVGSYLTIKSAFAHCDTWRIHGPTWKYIWLHAWKMA